MRSNAPFDLIVVEEEEDKLERGNASSCSLPRADANERASEMIALPIGFFTSLEMSNSVLKEGIHFACV